MICAHCRWSRFEGLTQALLCLHPQHEGAATQACGEYEREPGSDDVRHARDYIDAAKSKL